MTSVSYISTRGGAPRLGFEDVLLAGLARDGGLYVPESWPALDAATIAGFAGRPFAEVAAEIIGRFSGEELPTRVLGEMAADAYATFGHAAVTPLVQLDAQTFVLELFHGPTLAFKDVAMQMLARLMDHVLEKRGQRVTIVGATSGDTGGAAIEAFRTSKRVDVVILFPDGRVSDVQRRMMTTPTETNVHAVAIDGTFDDCQALVKAMFNDHAFRDSVALAGVNSINWARIVAQVTYYFVAAVALGAPHRSVAFTVPTGNFGDIFAGYVAKQMGLPVADLVIASNENDILPRTLETGTYEMRDVVATSSPSMDIQISSNFERYLFEASGRDDAYVRNAFASLAQSRRFDTGRVAMGLSQEFSARAASEADVAQAIRHVAATSGYLMDPHTACAYVAASSVHKAGRGVPRVVLSTAHPAKFPDAMEAITGSRPGLPPRLAGLMSAPERFERLANDLATVERFVESRARAVREGQTAKGGA
ncbi:MAG: threonine synthase [Hyphomicrobiaceae bacterium]|nr:threonine synthase [Hyphomicrobiaceae bacterium]